MEKSFLIVSTLLGLVSVAVATDGTATYYNSPYTRTTITVKVVDYCPNCNGTFDLSREAFLEVSTNLDVGNIKIDYNQV